MSFLNLWCMDLQSSAQVSNYLKNSKKRRANNVWIH